MFEDEGFSGASLTRPALERLRDRAAEGAFEVLLCHAPDRLARRYAYQVLLLEELPRVGVEVCFAKEPRARRHPRGRAAAPVPGDDRRVRARADPRAHPPREAAPRPHRPPGGDVGRALRLPVRQEDRAQEGFWEIDEARRRSCARCSTDTSSDDVSIGELARWLTDAGRADPDRQDGVGPLDGLGDAAQPRLSRAGRIRQDEDAERHGRPTRTTRARGERHGRRPAREDQPAEKWTLIPVPPLVTEETFELAQARLATTRTSPSATPRSRRCCRASSSAASAATPATAPRPARPTSGSTTTAASARTTTATPAAASATAARSAPTSSTGSSGRRSAGCSRTPRSSAPRSTAASRRCGPSTPPPAAEKRSSATSPAPRAPSSV